MKLLNKYSKLLKDEPKSNENMSGSKQRDVNYYYVEEK